MSAAVNSKLDFSKTDIISNQHDRINEKWISQWKYFNRFMKGQEVKENFSLRKYSI